MSFALTQYTGKPLYTDLLQMALSSMPQAVCIFDTEANIAYANDAFQALWGLSQEELVPERNAERLAKQLEMITLGSAEALVDAPDATGDCQRIEFRDGRVFDLLELKFRLDAKQSFTLAIWRDQSQQEFLLADLEEQLGMFKTLTNMLPDQLFFKDVELCYTEVNDSFLLHHGLESADAILGLGDSTLLSKEHWQRSEIEEQNILKTGKPIVSDLREEVRLNGDRVWSQCTKLPYYDTNGDIVGIFGFSIDVTDQRRNEQLIWRQANYDHLTQLPNRRLLAERWHSAWQAHLRDPKGIGLLLINLDHFKMVNDSLGYQSGEQLLVSVAERLRRCVRSKDSIARLSGDEFAILATDVKNEDDLKVVVRKVQAQFEEPYILDRNPVTIHSSIGVALAPEDGEDLDTIMMHADQALHEVKRNGGKGWKRFTEELHTNVSQQFSLANDLRYAVKNQEFSINFQPIVDMQSNLEWVKVETLIRWHHPRRGWVSPADFIPVAEQTGLIVEIGEWVFYEAVERLAEIQQATGQSLKVSVNVSPRQLKAESFDPNRWLEHAKKLGIDPHNIIIEITEGMFLDPDERVLGHLDHFADLGMKISLDDFGTGYASVSFLENFSVDVLKLDRAFVNDAEKTPRRRILAEAIINMARALELQVVAEGIETEAQSDWLRAAGIEYGQGYFYSKPLTPGKLQQQLCERLGLADPEVSE